jgi:hypothetical protein
MIERNTASLGRLTGTAERFAALNPTRAARYPIELIAREIADHAGNVWASVAHFGISYEHACRIRAGWRGARRPRSAPIVYAHSRHPIKYREAMYGPVS